MRDAAFELRPVGHVASPLTDLAAAPKQGFEGAPDAWLHFDPVVGEALEGLRAGDMVVLLTWLHRARRDVLTTHPRDDPGNPLQGVFNTRSPARPNPIGMHEVTILERDGLRLRVSGLEAIDGTPIVDVKPLLRRP